MRTLKKSGITTLAVASATLAAAVLAGGAASAPAVVPTPASTPIALGWIALETGARDRITLDVNADGTAEEAQTISAPVDCKLAFASNDPEILTFSGTLGTGGTGSGVPSFGSDSIGIAEKTSGTSCSQVNWNAKANARETLTIDLGDEVASAAYLDVELKGGARVLATAKLGTTVKGLFELQSGTAVTPTPGAVVFACKPASDSGPDAGVKDNCRWPIGVPSWMSSVSGLGSPVVFDSLELKPLSGSVSLEGGSDGLVPSVGLPALPTAMPQLASLFELTGLQCGDVTEELFLSGTAPGVVVTRLNNANPAEACVGIPYTLTSGTQSATFLKPATQSTAQFVFTMTWTQEATSGPARINPTVGNFRLTGPATGQQAGDVTLGWCPDPLITDGVLTGLTSPPYNVPSMDLDATLGGVQYACIATQRAEVVPVLNGTDKVVVHEQVYVLGDYTMRKP